MVLKPNSEHYLNDLLRINFMEKYLTRAGIWTV